jgi:hypothetical protein
LEGEAWEGGCGGGRGIRQGAAAAAHKKNCVLVRLNIYVVVILDKRIPSNKSQRTWGQGNKCTHTRIHTQACAHHM